MFGTHKVGNKTRSIEICLTSKQMQVQSWDMARCPEEYLSPVGMPYLLQMLFRNAYFVKIQIR